MPGSVRALKFLTLNAYAVSVSTLSTRAARIMRENMDTIGRNSRHKKTWRMLDSRSRRCAIMSSSPPARINSSAKLGIGNARACPVGAVAHSCRNELEGRSPGDRADRPQSQHERDACFGIDSKARDPGFESMNFLSVRIPFLWNRGWERGFVLST